VDTLDPRLLTDLLYLLGAGFLVFNLYLFLQYWRNQRLQPSAPWVIVRRRG